jgi:nicotinic acid mononucleotide adenylyltransferase
MKNEDIRSLISRLSASGEPRVELIKRANPPGARVGIFSSSFNPPTVAHVELMRQASASFGLDETLALAGLTNADKVEYEASLEDRIVMVVAALEANPRTSIGVSSHPFFTDMLDALRRVYDRQTELHFVVGLDTFERVLDREDKYTNRYHRTFSNRLEALEYLLRGSRLIVANRGVAGLDEARAMGAAYPPELSRRILYLDFPSDLADRSATDVRERIGAGQSIAGLVGPGVEHHILAKGLYRPADYSAL